MVIDLHLHTTASDGRLTPAELVARAAAAGTAVMAVTDHDTTAACADVAGFARAQGLDTITGIEITAVEGGRDVHMLGYGVDVDDAGLRGFLRTQRAIRVTRAGQIAERLAGLGMPVDITPWTTAAATSGRTLGRPQVADAMIAAGHVASRTEAFERWLGVGRPAFVPRDGAPPERVIGIVHAARGVISLAHPGRTRLGDDRIAALAASGLDALEVYHSDHDETQVAHYAALADRLGLHRSGGSDFHGDPAHGIDVGSVSLPEEHWLRLRAAADARRTAWNG